MTLEGNQDLIGCALWALLQKQRALLGCIDRSMHANLFTEYTAW